MQEHLCSYMTTAREREKFAKRASHRFIGFLAKRASHRYVKAMSEVE